FYPCVMGILECIRGIFRELNVPFALVSFVFDERTDSHLLLKAWNLAKRLQRMAESLPVDAIQSSQLPGLAVMGDITFADDRKCIPLQCADLLAWHVRRDYISPAEDHGRTLPEYERLKTVGAFCSHLENEETVRNSRLKVWQDAIEFYKSKMGK